MFRTPVSIAPSDHPITVHSKLLSVGSCFADFIGNQLVKHKFQIVSNPFGVVFHPLAQFQLLEMALNGDMPGESSYVEHQGIWYNFYFHGSFSTADRGQLEHKIQVALQNVQHQLKRLDYLFLTFGTAIQYEHLKSGIVVANCHKVPQNQFRKSLTPVSPIVESFEHLLSCYPDLAGKVILSVSPIRHLKEGIENNSVSKSTLRLVCEEIISRFQNMHYFPGFEIMIDDLRDYRFYEKDMIHPNDTARDYIWKMFIENYLDSEARQFVEAWGKIAQSLEHRPFHPHSSAHQVFIKKILKKIERFPDFIDTSKETEQLKKQLL